MLTVAGYLRQGYEANPDNIAINLQRAGQPDLAITRADLWEHAHEFVDLFAYRGIEPGDVVILILA